MRTLLFALTLAASLSGQPAKPKPAEVDRIFAAFNTHTPGCAVGVSEHGTVALRAGYGMADLERGVPVTADTVFESGSVAKRARSRSTTPCANTCRNCPTMGPR
jgi:CubicO group peptidase (beta-lactamase class C family)